MAGNIAGGKLTTKLHIAEGVTHLDPFEIGCLPFVVFMSGIDNKGPPDAYRIYWSLKYNWNVIIVFPGKPHTNLDMTLPWGMRKGEWEGRRVQKFMYVYLNVKLKVIL